MEIWERKNTKNIASAVGMFEKESIKAAIHNLFFFNTKHKKNQLLSKCISYLTTFYNGKLINDL